MPSNPTPAEGVVVPLELLQRAHTFIEDCAFNGELQPTADSENPCELATDLAAYIAARPAAPTQSAAQTGEVDPEVIERLIEVMCDCQCEGSHMLSESVANEHADDLRAVLSVFRPSLALSQLEPSE